MTARLTAPRTTINVREFGAVGDGGHDDTAAIQAACNAGEYVYFPTPPLCYVITDKITCPNNVLSGDSRISDGPGTFSKIVTWDNNSTMFEFTGPVSGMRFITLQEASGVPNGNGMKLVTVGNGTDWSASSHFNDCWFTGGYTQLELNLCQGFVITDCVFDGGYQSVDCNSTPNLLFSNNIICQPYNQGMWIHGDNSYNLQIIGNEIQVQATNPASPWRPTFAGMGMSQSGIWFDECFGALVDANVFNANYQGIGLNSYSGNGVRDISISNNLFTGHFAPSVAMNSVSRVTLANNHFVPYAPGIGTEIENELVECPHVLVAGASDRVIVRGGSMVGNTNRITGVQLGVGTTNCYVGDIMWEGLGPIDDFGGTGNTSGPFIPALT